MLPLEPKEDFKEGSEMGEEEPRELEEEAPPQEPEEEALPEEPEVEAPLVYYL